MEYYPNVNSSEYDDTEYRLKSLISDFNYYGSTSYLQKAEFWCGNPYQIYHHFTILNYIYSQLWGLWKELRKDHTAKVSAKDFAELERIVLPTTFGAPPLFEIQVGILLSLAKKFPSSPLFLEEAKKSLYEVRKNLKEEKIKIKYQSIRWID